MYIPVSSIILDEARDTARRAYAGNTRLSSADIGKTIGRARRTVDAYIADLRAVNQMDTDIKIFCMHRLGIPQDRVAKQMGINQASIHNHLLKMATLPNLINADLVRGFTVTQVAEKHGWPEPLVWSLALEGKNDHDRFKALGWGLRTWDQWEFNDCDNRFGDDWPGRTRALRSNPSHGMFHLCNRVYGLSAQRKNPTWSCLIRPTLIKNAADYDKKSISGLSKTAYLEFLEAFFVLLKQNVKKTTRLAFINAYWALPAGM